MSDAEKDRKMKLLEMHVARLAEHFDCVQVFVSTHVGGDQGTIHAAAGAGNHFAREGQVANWLNGHGEGVSVEDRGDD